MSIITGCLAVFMKFKQRLHLHQVPVIGQQVGKFTALFQSVNLNDCVLPIFH